MLMMLAVGVVVNGGAADAHDARCGGCGERWGS